MENKVIENKAEVKVKEREFVEFSYSSSDAFQRREAVKKASEHIKSVVKATGGSMPKELIDAYEGLHEVLGHIKKVELTVIGIGR